MKLKNLNVTKCNQILNLTVRLIIDFETIVNKSSLGE